jgi:hypothetical protein
MHKVNPAYCNKYEESIRYIRELEGIVAERKEKVTTCQDYLTAASQLNSLRA